MVTETEVREGFSSRFGKEAELVVRAPGRINLIGEHTDYNDGFVLPAAIDYYTWVAAMERGDRRLNVIAENMGGQQVSVHLDSPMIKDPKAPWSDYVLGVVQALQERDFRLSGADILLQGNVPQGAGLSSSASLEVALVRALTGLSGESITPEEAARVGQAAENDFVGCQCGIMDQLASATGQTSSAVLIDCRDLSNEPVPMPRDWELLIVDSGIRRGLVDSEYNRRRQQCEAAARHFGCTSLRDVTLDQLLQAEGTMPHETFRRARHVLTENTRTLQASRALRKADMTELAAAMAASHRSMRDDFEITTPAIDQLVELMADASQGRAGIRMTGGGFGGCVVAIAEPDWVPALESAAEKQYPDATGYQPRLIRARASAGAYA